MKIILAVTNDITIDQRVLRTAVSLSRMPAEVLIIGRLFRNPAIPVKGIKLKRMKLWFNRGPFFYAEYNLRLFFYLLFQKADVFTANDLDTLPAVFIAAKIRNKVLVYDSHEYFTEVPELIGRPKVKMLWEKIEMAMVPRVPNASTVSSAIAAIYQQKYGIRMEVIHNFPLRLNFIPRNVETDEDQKIIVYQGALNRGRGLECAILAMQFIKNARLIIIGTGDIENDLRALVKNKGLTRNISFTGRILPGELPAYTSTAHLGISIEEDMGLSYRYSLPNKVFDYIQAQIPVLVSDFPEIGMIVKSYNVGMINTARDPEALAGIFSEMLTNKKKRIEWKKNLARAAMELCWENEEEKLFRLYHHAITSDRAFSAGGK